MDEKDGRERNFRSRHGFSLKLGRDITWTFFVSFNRFFFNFGHFSIFKVIVKTYSNCTFCVSRVIYSDQCEFPGTTDTLNIEKFEKAIKRSLFIGFLILSL